jgi:hypothetical protein
MSEIKIGDYTITTGNIPKTPSVPTVPKIPKPDLPSVPTMPNVPSVPKLPSAPQIPEKKDIYYERDIAQSSTSKYIQANAPNVNGGFKKQDVLNKTPDAKIISPQLKKDVNIVAQLAGGAGGLLAALASAIMSLFGKAIQSDIAETPPTGDKAEYGKLQVKENKAGFVEIRDETPGNVRKIDLHPTGTYDSMLDNGNREDKTTGKKLTMVDKNWEIVVFENELIVINKDYKLHIKQDSYTNINGNENINVDKDSSEVIKGNKKLNIKGNNTVKIEGNEGVGVDGNQKIDIGGNLTEKVSGNIEQKVSGNVKEKVSGTKNEIVGSVLTITAGQLIRISAPKIKLG